ncbi:hypothetical protein GGX14DRAFT_653732 [Mycena pura]|uniref:Uncharacterized protein n=1 Tax=Mycena pura TaxID=153505 RepID=A0AAD6V8F6_9AGAR|nr:hypothetical protein GGX14DRAFT_653732 [Mycena pura]
MAPVGKLSAQPDQADRGQQPSQKIFDFSDTEFGCFKVMTNVAKKAYVKRQTHSLNADQNCYNRSLSGVGWQVADYLGVADYLVADSSVKAFLKTKTSKTKSNACLSNQNPNPKSSKTVPILIQNPTNPILFKSKFVQCSNRSVRDQSKTQITINPKSRPFRSIPIQIRVVPFQRERDILYSRFNIAFDVLTPLDNDTLNQGYIGGLILQTSGKAAVGNPVSLTEGFGMSLARHFVNGTNAGNLLDFESDTHDGAFFFDSRDGPCPN